MIAKVSPHEAKRGELREDEPGPQSTLAVCLMSDRP